MKKMLSILLSLALCLGMISVGLQITAVAANVNDNPAGTTLNVLNENGVMNANYGTIEVNNQCH